MDQMGAPFFAKAPGRMAFVMRDNVKVGGCVWQHTAATGIGKGMIRNGIFAGIRLILLCQIPPPNEGGGESP
jgi:hypothetical protein